MSGIWKVFLDEARSASDHMEYDERLAREGAQILRVFMWSPPAFSLGFRQVKPEWLNEVSMREPSLEVVERPTGGGIALHGSDVSCSIIVPQSSLEPIHEIMSRICSAVKNLCGLFGAYASIVLEVKGNERITVCLSEPSSYALYAYERKLAGFAVRRFPGSWLIQGSLLIRPLPEILERVLPVWLKEDLSRRSICLSEVLGRSVSEQEVSMRFEDEWHSLWVGAMAPQMELVV